MSNLKKIEEWNQGNLPTWKECKRVIENDDYAISHGQTRVIDEEPIPTALHRFVHEHEPCPNKDGKFREDLIAVLNEAGNLGEWRGKIFNPEL